MKNYWKYIKELLLIANQKGFEVNYETKSVYSEKYNAISTKSYLKFWYKAIKVDDKTGEAKEYWYCKTQEFSGITREANVIKYLQECINGKENSKES